MKEINKLIRRHKKEVEALRNRLQEKSVQYSDTRETLAKALGCSVGAPGWWDTTNSEKDRLLLERAMKVMKQLSQAKAQKI